MPAARRLSEKQHAADRADRDRLNSASDVIRARAREAYYKIGVFPDHAYPFASLLNVIALHIADVPSGVRDEALVVVTAVENGLATPDTLTGEVC
jgi:hypothetical protein